MKSPVRFAALIEDEQTVLMPVSMTIIGKNGRIIGVFEGLDLMWLNIPSYMKPVGSLETAVNERGFHIYFSALVPHRFWREKGERITVHCT